MVHHIARILEYHLPYSAELVLRAVRRIPLEISQRLAKPINRLHFLRRVRAQYKLRPNDIFIVTYPRSGTTWLQMILYQLTTDGQMDFFHISDHVPWFERCLEHEVDIEGISERRLFKTHLPYRWIPKGTCKYIYVTRDGMDVAVSYYYLDRNHGGFRGSFDDYFGKFMRGQVGYGSWFTHVEQWKNNDADLQVLYLTYEDLKCDLPACIRRIADFCGVALDQHKLQRTVERSSFDYMKQHEAQFGLDRLGLWERGIRERDFIRLGRTGQSVHQFNNEQLSIFQRRYREHFQTPHRTEQREASAESSAAPRP